MSFSKKPLEFNSIITKISKYAKSNVVKNELISIIPSTSFDNVSMMLNETNEMLALIVMYGSLPFLDNYDNNIIHNFKDIERIFNIDELLNIRLLLNMEFDFRNYIKDIKEQKSTVYENYLKQIFNHKDLLAIFNNVFNIYGEVDDKASSDLYKIRKDLKRLHNNLDNKMQALLKSNSQALSENIIVTRNNRLCLAVKESYKNKIRGVIHDVSQSGQTFFIEPQASLEITAQIELAKIDEEKEIIKIFQMLTSEVVTNIQTLKNNIDIFFYLDVLSSKAKYGLDIDGIKPKINNEGIVNLVNAKHPLLEKKEAVPISLSLNNDDNTLLITGPNTGGKTVAIKTIGLLTMMVQSGILVPTNQESNFNVFDAIYADIGDDQSIIHSLSTFSSHMTNIVKMINNLDDNNLILLDELGSGTDPNEGVSLAIAIIEEFRKKDIKLVVTSHYSELKNYAYETKGIKVASVAFDKVSLQPLYYLQHGISGESHARLIAKRLGLNEDVINRANMLHDGRETDLAKIMAKLNDEKLELEKDKLKLSEELTKYQKAKTLYEEEHKAFVLKQERLLKDIKEKEEAKWQEATKDITNILEELKDKQSISQPELAKIKGDLSKKPARTKVITNETFKVGDKVLIKPYQQYGDIVEVNNNKYRIVFGLFDLEFSAHDLTKVDQPKKVVKRTKRKVVASDQVTKTGTMKLDLRGYRYEEVYEAMDSAIDQALISNLYSLTVIHGFGTGAVRNAVYEYIKKSTHIASHRFGGEGEGLNGATIINLK